MKIAKGTNYIVTGKSFVAVLNLRVFAHKFCLATIVGVRAYR